MNYQDIHLEDKALWNQLQTAWEQDDYTTALSKLQDSSITDKKLSADKINFATSELKRLQSQNDDVFKSGKNTHFYFSPCDNLNENIVPIFCKIL